LWQFTRYTGHEYMTVNELVDERFDVYLSSMAAARFLKENYRQLGSWPMALTAYNYGRSGMVRAKNKGQIIKIIIRDINEIALVFFGQDVDFPFITAGIRFNGNKLFTLLYDILCGFVALTLLPYCTIITLGFKG
ncbi:MAG: lytic transglycosylase domain-containing protein, partial [Candidatus Electrothrix sp. ATG1]|nr:lytic transglycosylase domain-containing protein [Candidatus Electrothrix sp. ATG1]